MCREAETMTTTKKKKGRPSLLEIQKRNLKQQQQQQQQDSPSQSNPNSSLPIANARSTRRNPTLDADESRPKRHRTLNSEAALNMPSIASSSRGSDPTEEKILRATDTNHVSLVESGPITPLPDKKLLVFILDRLQKKDTHGVFSEPVDPEELPDYHDIIEHPMDFGTVRRKLDEGAYSSLEQFEKDIFLICSNAMEYNATNTVFFRQARSIQELAKKDFDNLRQDSDDSEPQPKVARRGRPPGKNLKKLLGSSSAEPVGPELSDATLGTGGDNGSWPKTYNLRKIHTPDKVQLADTPVRATLGSHNTETYSNYLSEWENEFPASVLKAVLKYGKKSFTVDENRRESYKLSLASENGASVLNTLKGESKQLIAVGLQTEEHGYSRSLAQFAADLGPRVWKIASKKISSVLPNGVKFGPGWVGENDMPVGKQQCMNDSLTNDHISRVVCPNTSGADRCVADAEGAIKGLSSSVNGTVDVGNRPRAHQIQQDPGMSSFPPQAGMGRAGTSTGHLGLDETSMGSRMQGMNRSSISLFHASNNNVASTRFPHGGAVYGKSPWQGLGMTNSPDLNIRSMEPGSKLQSGSSQQQPDLALQL